ncbi:hypothetical protein OPV22_003873 [Ensete ventricosum]|uniref:Uncharacterized protein n=1 Tax=Ensete ventricosum TaxID=4639 RepID=A0AAV8S217_ENSVE|nr:hypothetical protein OPV22_003873 [Ensete ventricosum]
MSLAESPEGEEGGVVEIGFVLLKNEAIAFGTHFSDAAIDFCLSNASLPLDSSPPLGLANLTLCIGFHQRVHTPLSTGSTATPSLLHCFACFVFPLHPSQFLQPHTLKLLHVCH